MITAIQVQKRNKDKVNLFVDGEFVCALTAESVVRARLKVGDEVTDEALEQIILTSETEIAFKKSLDYIARSMKTEKQVRDYLSDKGFDGKAVDAAVARLAEYRYVDDGRFAEQYVEYSCSGKGERRIRNELLSKGLSEETVKDALEKIPQDAYEETAQSLAEKFLKNKPHDFKTLNKLARFLLGRGFDYDTVKAVVERSKKDDWD